MTAVVKRRRTGVINVCPPRRRAASSRDVTGVISPLLRRFWRTSVAGGERGAARRARRLWPGRRRSCEILRLFAALFFSYDASVAPRVLHARDRQSIYEKRRSLL